MRKYVTVQGDLWDVISHRVYKSEMHIHVLIAANPQYRSVVVFPANCVLNIPEISRSERVSFPTWRRNA